MDKQESKWLYFFIGLAILVNFSGLFIPLMDPDAGVYASVSKNMLLRNNYWELYFQGKDWLDKPHFPFWLTAASFKIFGINTWAYKLPGILFVLLGAYYTYLFAKQYYTKTVALWSVFILLTAEHIIISNNDVRAEPFLTGLIIASIYHFSNTLNKNNWWHLIAGCFFAACCIMTKGVFTLIPVGGAIAGELIIKRNWKELFHWRWLAALILISIFIFPELYSLWYQFDSHPEKVVFGRNNVSGIKFFLWDSQFGRFMNTGPIKGKGDPTFFLHTLLWAFLPWSLIMYASLFDKIKNGLKKINIKQEEWFMITGSLLTLFVFSISKFQLSYYSNIIFPLLAILTAQYVWKIQNTTSRAFKITLNSITFILIIGMALIQFFYWPAAPAIVSTIILPVVISAFISIYQLLKAKWASNLVAFYRVGLASLVVNLYLNLFFYPDLLTYQSSDQAAFYINEKYPGTPAVCSAVYAPSFEFYLKDKWIKADTNMMKTPGPAKEGIWYVMEEELDYMNQRGIRYEIIKELKEFHVTMLSLKFINKKTREKELRKHFLVKLL